ncbi:hypothetical protein [Stenotrophomonas sp. Iso1]|uniref:hypothetical protein n=1 Tax=Stenotrophomonas sp. Iso1 TaxID=2977283 RepID=UPI0022B7A7D9|nr:hypothetical protein [Stenotrophomonas sp. Iso1]
MKGLSIFREWCKENGPIFDFFSKIVFALFTGTIAYFAVGIAKTQSEIQKSALEVQRTQALAQIETHLPNIQLRYSLRNLEGPRFDDLIISNEGSDLFSLEVEIFPFWHPRELEVIRTGESRNPPLQLKSALIPIRNLFSSVIQANSESRGQLRIIQGKPHTQWNLATREFEESITTERRSITSDIKIFSRISYADKFGESHTRYFETQFWGMRPISDSEGASIANRYYQQIRSGNSIDFDTPNKESFDSNWKLLRTP